MIPASTENQSPLVNTTGYAMLLIDGLKLLIPQQQIIALEMARDMEINRTDDSVTGFLQFNNKSWPIFCFNYKLSLTTPSGSTVGRFCVLLQSENTYYGILSEQAILLNPEEITLQPLPDAMSTADSPFSALTIYEGEITCISSAELLTNLLPVKILSKTGKAR